MWWCQQQLESQSLWHPVTFSHGCPQQRTKLFPWRCSYSCWSMLPGLQWTPMQSQYELLYWHIIIIINNNTCVLLLIIIHKCVLLSCVLLLGRDQNCNPCIITIMWKLHCYFIHANSILILLQGDAKTHQLFSEVHLHLHVLGYASLLTFIHL